ncbi:MAG: AIPR family protein [Microscillaceae bacterium]|nr:AIPR family protein [Microscillaceae bacterium]
MITIDFYNTLDAELTQIIEKYKDDKFLKIQKGEQAENNKKSYALLIWFLEFYAKKGDYLSYITDSNFLINNKNGNQEKDTFKDIDSSCDVIFDNIDNFGNKVFYIVQSKWNNAENSKGEISTTEIKKALNDFETILRGDTNKVNQKLQKKLENLYEHLKNNGEVKFIFLSLCKANPKSEDNIKSFLAGQEKTKVEIIDIDRLKLDYIDRKFKKIDPINPLENYYNPEEIKIPLQVERLGMDRGNYIKIEKPFDAYVFLVRPKTIFELFDHYGFYLFFKNVRNPLLQSDFNREIEKTALDNPAYFWYYNNGITAITYAPFPVIRPQAENLELNGLQIINGAQTVYSIYSAYKNASPAKKAEMDSEILITLRLLKSGGEDFDLNVTRFTNSQNPVQDRDFCANDPIQEKLQREFYNTKFWYQKRNGEFRRKDQDVKEVLDNKGVKIIPNHIFATTYLAYHLQDPVSVFKNFQQIGQSHKDLIFLSHKEHPEGLYERIFNDKTDYEDMLCSFCVFDIIFQRTPLKFESTAKTNLYHLLALFKIVFTKYIHKKLNDKVSIKKYIIKLYEENNKEIILKTFKFLNLFVKKQLGELEDKISEEQNIEKHIKFLTTLSYYERIRDELESLDLDITEIEKTEITDIKELIIEGSSDDDDKGSH